MMHPPVYSYSNHMGRILLLALEEILGRNESNSLLSIDVLKECGDHFPSTGPHFKFPFSYVSKIESALDACYGTRAGRGISLRVGRALLKYLLREFDTELGMTGLNFRLLPWPYRLVVGTEALAGVFNNFTDELVSLEMDGKQIAWRIKRCPHCWDRHVVDPCCTLVVGMLQEYLYWMSGGKYFRVDEKSCIACGDSECTIVIDRVPLG